MDSTLPEALAESVAILTGRHLATEFMLATIMARSVVPYSAARDEKTLEWQIETIHDMSHDASRMKQMMGGNPSPTHVAAAARGWQIACMSVQERFKSLT